MKQPDPSRAPWWLRPLFARGQFSPRLLMAWQAFYLAGYVVYKYVNSKSEVLNGVLVQPGNIVELVGVLLGFVGLALGLGTLQTVKLGDTPVAGPPPDSQPLPDAVAPGGTTIPTAE